MQATETGGETLWLSYSLESGDWLHSTSLRLEPAVAFDQLFQRDRRESVDVDPGIEHPVASCDERPEVRIGTVMDSVYSSMPSNMMEIRSTFLSVW